METESLSQNPEYILLRNRFRRQLATWMNESGDIIELEGD